VQLRRSRGNPPPDPGNRIVIPTGAYPDFLLRAASDDHGCGSPQREPYALPQRHHSQQEFRGSVVEEPAVSPFPTLKSDLSHSSPLVIPTEVEGSAVRFAALSNPS
jgi:hypothetical protein